MADATAPASRLEILPVTGMGEVQPGDDLAELIATAAPWLAAGDVVVVTSKVVSKAEGRLVPAPTDPAGREAARQAAVEAETVRLVARRGRTRIVQIAQGLVLAAAGVDASNVDTGRLALLPENPDRSAAAIRAGLADRLGIDVAVLVTDTMGRPWRLGLTDVAIGAAGIAPIRDHRGEVDTHGNELIVTEVAVADELAAAAELVKGKAAGVPVAIVRGFAPLLDTSGPGAAVLIRSAAEDMFSLGTAEARALGRREAQALRHPTLEFATGPVDPTALRQALATAVATPGPTPRIVRVLSAGTRNVVLDALRTGLPAAVADPAGAAPELLVVCLSDRGGELSGFELAGVGARLTAALAAQGLASCWLPGLEVSPVLLDVPADWRPIGVLAAGLPVVPAPPDEPEPDLAGYLVER